ncbi:MAG: alpha/beta hydrolase-fold protein [Sorangiineae bacterium]|nr:alpha/beta hydrolase-fold protein [Polyangiaceae bacterium]MEB2323203.1 alpha/beta hydrolase-fold protein [Sorangiineae bacterium]
MSLRRRPRALVLSGALFAAAVGGCGSGDESAGPTDAGTVIEVPETPPTFGGPRPVKVFRVPAGYDPSRPAPLVMILHGYSVNGLLQSMYLRLTDIADSEGFFVVAPDGTPDANGKRYWNATDVCCATTPSAPDDVAYLSGLVDEIRGVYAIDPKRIFLVGHSNGGFMANRLACDRADQFAAIVSIAGAMWKDPARCQPAAPVGVLQIHGDADTTVPYGGGKLPANLLPEQPDASFPGAEETVADWAANNGCAAALEPAGAPFDLDESLEGDETTPARHSGCAKNGAAELWTIHGGEHIPPLAKDAPERIWGFLAAHHKP